ncbi:ATP-binding protein [Gelidibacter gilvus]|uniref:ATP-binding protein n=1 Tax=Gelidibacter gilvus TaxID=59602 RepID=A0A4Q0XCY7_9FLAO|nr:ATP-binding protein [Gelidibacter gilvus]RXJ45577.1 ATP-binding protein [Gelidibacter gilvus]
MELKYIWIEDYKNLKKIGFNFNHNGKDEFEFKDGKLNIFNSNDIIPKGFFGDSILGVTGIVGKNGSGKTNLAEFINYNLAHVTNSSVSFFGENNIGIIILGKWIFIHKSITIENLQELKNQGYEENYYEKAPLDKGRGNLRFDSMEKNRYIYYNPSFDFRMINVRSNLSNISTSYLAFNDLYHNLKHYYGIDKKENKTDSLSAHYKNEKIRESNFIINYSDELKRLIGRIPTEMYLSIDNTENNQLLNFRYISEEELKNDPKKQIKYQNQRDLSDLENEIVSVDNIFPYKVSEPIITGYDIYEIPISYKKIQFKRLFFVQLFKILLFDNEFPNGEFRELECLV